MKSAWLILGVLMLQRAVSSVQGCRSQVSVAKFVYFGVEDGRYRSGLVVAARYRQIEVMVGVVEVGEKLQSNGMGSNGVG